MTPVPDWCSLRSPAEGQRETWGSPESAQWAEGSLRRGKEGPHVCRRREALTVFSWGRATP